MSKTSAPPPVASGQVWVDLDPRQHRREVLVHDIEGGYAQCSILESGRATRLALSRFNGRRNGYEFKQGDGSISLEQSIWRTIDTEVQKLLKPRQTEWIDGDTGQSWQGPEVTKTRKAVWARFQQLLGPTLRS